jgi:hypothetical protein
VVWKFPFRTFSGILSSSILIIWIANSSHYFFYIGTDERRWESNCSSRATGVNMLTATHVLWTWQEHRSPSAVEWAYWSDHVGNSDDRMLSHLESHDVML